MAHQFDFDYNFDPVGTSPVVPDPYADHPIDDVAELRPTKRSVYDRQRGSSPPRASENDRSHSKSPKPTEPSPEYLSVTLEPSSKLSDPRTQRKLLVLDLNGTLVFRSPHQKRNAYQMRGNQRPLRPVHKRPYLDSFRDYLFHPKTREWLDTMVWSSAQPHSVADMTEHCFGGKKGELVAIMARDTLGLSEEEYHRKSQTTKDLARLWAHALLARYGHSARSTILLDDSPLKARLQPWNHVCIKEYVAEMRKSDVKVADADRLRELQEQRGNQAEELEEDLIRKRKGGKKATKFADRVAQAEANATGEDGQPLEYDGTLLAVIGVLDAIKEESNVAGWMRSGGLLNVVARSRSGTPGPTKKRRQSDIELSPDTETSSSPLPPSSSPPSPSSSSSVEQKQEETGVPLEETPSPVPHHLWFDHPNAFRYWVSRGRHALNALGIPINHGVVGSIS
ncbi:hypothetical protein NMY22_g6784 [Coprinellus aureogranulatus]|nr:hypothetical protein NMY22_g6784 [Coprinellus aureogranulatus]